MTKALAKAIDEARAGAEQLPAGPLRDVLARLIGIVRRLADKPQIEQPIAPEPPPPEPDAGLPPPPRPTPFDGGR